MKSLADGDELTAYAVEQRERVLELEAVFEGNIHHIICCLASYGRGGNGQADDETDCPERTRCVSIEVIRSRALRNNVQKCEMINIIMNYAQVNP